MTRYDGRMPVPRCWQCHDPIEEPAYVACLYCAELHDWPKEEDAVDVAGMRTDLAAALAALQAVASPGATDAERERALALVAECGERWGLGGSDT